MMCRQGCPRGIALVAWLMIIVGVGLTVFFSTTGDLVYLYYTGDLSFLDILFPMMGMLFAASGGLLLRWRRWAAWAARACLVIVIAGCLWYMLLWLGVEQWGLRYGGTIDSFPYSVVATMLMAILFALYIRLRMPNFQ